MTPPERLQDVTLADFDAAIAAELPRVSHVEYDSHEICKHFAGKIRERLEAAAALSVRGDDTKRLDWLQDNELDLVTLREESAEGEYLILWFVVDGRKSTKRALHSVSGHPLGCPREAIDAAMPATPPSEG